MPPQSGDGLASPPSESPIAWMRRRWLARGHHRGLRYWLWFWGVPLLAGFGVLFAVNGMLLGWRVAYDVMVAITSPADTDHPVPAWLLSVAGWLLGPSLAGAAAGAMVTAAINGRRRRPFTQLFPDADPGPEADGG